MKIALALIAIVIILIVKKLVQRKVKRFELREKRDKRKEKIQNIFSKYKPLHIKKSEVSNIPDSDVLLLATVQLQNRKKIEFTCDEYNFCLLNSAKNIESYPLDKLEAYLISHFDIQPVSEFKNYRHG